MFHLDPFCESVRTHVRTATNGIFWAPKGAQVQFRGGYIPRKPYKICVKSTKLRKGILEITSLTHGQEIDEEMAKKIVEAEPSWISFSFDGIEDTYNSIRTPTKYKGKNYNGERDYR